MAQRGWLPLAVFVLAFVFHALYVRHKVRLPAQGWADAGIVDNEHWGFGPYIQARVYFTGYSYALSLAFAAVAFRRYRENQMCSARKLALGGVTLSGFLAVSGCFFLGCCGSPMLAVYLSLFGASFLPWAKPFIAGLTTALIALSFWLMRTRSRKEEGSASCCTLDEDGADKIPVTTTIERQPPQ
jgi:hypothetical protein